MKKYMLKVYDCDEEYYHVFETEEKRSDYCELWNGDEEKILEKYGVEYIDDIEESLYVKGCLTMSELLRFCKNEGYDMTEDFDDIPCLFL